MKIVQINTVPNGSTGSIMMNIHKELQKEGHDSYVVWGRGRKSENPNEIYMNDKLGVYFHALYSRLTGKTGFASKRSTKKLLKQLDIIKPDIIHLHNIHGYYINIELLFNYIKKNNIKVVWTLHDCWAFTGHCAHFDAIKCTKWKTQCFKCPQLNSYPKTFIDNSIKSYIKKKNIFTGVKNLTIITPSNWLSKLVNKSYLNCYNIDTISNGISTEIFKQIPKKCLKFRKNYHLEDKKIILGVSSLWGENKGLDVFLELSKVISNEYIIVLVGLTQKQIKKLPSNIIGIAKTNDVFELCDIYNSSDVYFNSSMEETFGLTTVEAMACGLNVIVYNKTALPEIVGEKGIALNSTDINELKEAIIKSINKKRNIEALNKNYNLNTMVNNYIKLYLMDDKNEKE